MRGAENVTYQNIGDVSGWRTVSIRRLYYAKLDWITDASH